MDKLDKIITESIRKVVNETHMSSLYHYIKLDYLNKAIESNKLRMSTAEGGQNLSLTRSKSNQQGFQYGTYAKNTIAPFARCNYARIEFDGQALMQIRNAKIKPFDFTYDQGTRDSDGNRINGKLWHNNYNNDMWSSYYGLPKDDDMSIDRQFWAQSEERLTSNKDFIDNPLKYINKIDIMIQNPENRDYEVFNDLMEEKPEWKDICQIHTTNNSFNYSR